jgi:ABC-2 type transport system permease protein
VEAGRAAVAGDYGAIMPHLWWVIAYAAVVFALAVIVSARRCTGTIFKGSTAKGAGDRAF